MVIFILFCFLLTACSTVSKDESVSISFMHGWGGSGFDHVGMRELFAEFEALNPGGHIVYDTSPDLGIVMEKAADMLAVDKAPSIISTNGNVQYVSSARKKGVALNLMPYLQEDETLRIGHQSAYFTGASRAERGNLYAPGCGGIHRLLV